MSIPKVIHYCWFGGNPLPKSAKKCMESWAKYCPDYKIVRWDESNFDINCTPYCEKMYNEKNYVLNGDENEDNIYNKS
jgi:mannosyltransferase OCH1-like enzyme